ncbi:MAG: hypothetical protein ACRD0H_31505 [Actinomycetes bacterium]
MTRTARPPYDPWRDVDGTPIPVGARVEQVAVATEHGALSGRLGTRGVVLRRSATRLVVRFAGQRELARIHPHLVRVITLAGQPPARPDDQRAPVADRAGAARPSAQRCP